MEPAPLGLGLQGGGCLERVFKLIVKPDAVESVGTVVLGAESGMPVKVYVGVAVRALIESLAGLIVGAEMSGGAAQIAVAARVGRRKTVAEPPRGQCSTCRSLQIAVASTFEAGGEI